MDNKIDVSNPLAQAGSGAPAPGSTPIDSVNAPANPVSSPLDPGTTPASMSVTGTPNNPAGTPQTPNPIHPAPQPSVPQRPGSFGQKLLSAIGGVLTGLQGVGQVALAPDHMAELARQQKVAADQKSQ